LLQIALSFEFVDPRVEAYLRSLDRTEEPALEEMEEQYFRC
jgi:hypothetical protein